MTKTRFTELFGKEIWQYMGAHENAAMLVDPWGSILAQRDQGAGVVAGELDAQRLSAVRAQLPALTHRVL